MHQVKKNPPPPPPPKKKEIQVGKKLHCLHSEKIQSSMQKIQWRLQKMSLELIL